MQTAGLGSAAASVAEPKRVQTRNVVRVLARPTTLDCRPCRQFSIKALHCKGAGTSLSAQVAACDHTSSEVCR
jgi:hypothetical protein